MSTIEVSDESMKQLNLEDDLVEDEGVDSVDSNEAKNDDEPNKDKKMKGALQSMIKNMVSSKQPTSLPICFSEPRSLLEKFTDFGLYMDILLEANNQQDEETRFLGVLKFYLSSWMQEKDFRSPFNPIIGEEFQCKFPHKDGSSTEYLAEQISHHPPTTAFIFHNTKQQILCHSYLAPTSKFWGNSMDNTMEGKIVYELLKYGEEYTANLPKIVAKGIVVGSLATEISGSCIFECKQTQYTAEIEFKNRGGILGKNKHMMVAKVKHSSNKKSLYTLEATWDGKITLISNKSKQPTSSLFFDFKSAPCCEKIVEPLDKQPENSSRRVWEKVIHNIKAENEDVAQQEKYNVEANQRVLAKSREGVQWVPKHFTKSENIYLFNNLIDLRKTI